MEHISPLLAKHKLAVSQLIQGNMVATLLLHESGQMLQSETPILTKDNSPQAFGSGCTYAKRYGLSAILGLSSDDDDDANIAQRLTPQAQPSVKVENKVENIDKQKISKLCDEYNFDKSKIPSVIFTVYKKPKFELLTKEEIEDFITNFAEITGVKKPYVKNKKPEKPKETISILEYSENGKEKLKIEKEI